MMSFPFSSCIYRNNYQFVIVQLACGKSSSDNCTYLVLSSTSTPPPTCVYQICQCNSNICRLRLDFMVRIKETMKQIRDYFLAFIFKVFSVNGPVVGTAVAGNAVNAGKNCNCLQYNNIIAIKTSIRWGYR